MAHPEAHRLPVVADGHSARGPECPDQGTPSAVLRAEGVVVPHTAVTRILQLLAVLAVGVLAGLMLAGRA